MKRSDANDKSRCPFDPVHLILNGRMAAHIEQCRKNFPNKKIERCDLNANHWFAPQDKERHYRECSGVPTFQRDQLQIGGRSFVPPLPQEHMQVVTTDEDWDVPAENQVSYLAVKDQLNASRKIVQLGPTNVGKAQRRQYHQDERERHMKLDEEQNRN